MNRRTLRRLAGLAACGALLTAVAVVGRGPSADRPEAARTSAAAPRASSRRAKRLAGIGSVSAEVVDRPASDRAVVEATWRRPDLTAPATVELVLPEGAHLVEGEVWQAVEDGVTAGTTRWLVGFPTGRALDAVVRLSARTLPATPEDPGVVATEAAVRLTEDVVDVAEPEEAR